MIPFVVGTGAVLLVLLLILWLAFTRFSDWHPIGDNTPIPCAECGKQDAPTRLYSYRIQSRTSTKNVTAASLCEACARRFNAMPFER